MNTSKLTKLMCLAALLLLLAACSGPTVLTEGDNGSEITIKTGETFEIQLAGNVTTGYSWELAEGGDGIASLQGEAAYKSEGNQTGAGGTFTFTFKGESAGETTLQLVYHRPWETDVEPLQTYAVRVIVSEE